MATALSELNAQAPADPDAQAVVTDFSDYTEFFPSDLIRSLALISKFDAKYEQDAATLHALAQTYGHLPSVTAEERPNPRKLRADISTTLDHAVRCRESTYAEAERICSVAEHLYSRLQSITRKLSALAKPPSRDPTPEPVAPARSPVASRKKVNDRSRQAATLDAKSNTRPGHGPKHHTHKIIIPGEILPPFDPASADAITEEESERDRPASPRLDDADTDKSPKLPKITLFKPPKQPKVPKDQKASSVTRKKLIRVRPPGVLGTNVHSTVAGISVSNAMAVLPPPPADARPGSKHAPWLSLTEWELNKLRKRMKKNADWVPSDTMVRRELAETGRGQENFLRAKAHSDSTGEPLINEEPDDFVRPLVLRKHYSNPLTDEASQELENRGMKLNQAKKLKREAMMREQQAINDNVVLGIGAPVAPMTLLSAEGDTSGTDPSNAPQLTVRAGTTNSSSNSSHKRKREQSPEPSAVSIDDSLVDPALLEAAIVQPLSKRVKLDASSKDDDQTLAEETSASSKSAARTKIPKGAGRASRGTADKPAITLTGASGATSSPLPVIAGDGERSKPQSCVISLALKQKAASAEPQRDHRASGRHVRRVSNASLPSIGDSPLKAQSGSPSQLKISPSAQAAGLSNSRRGGRRADPGLPISNGDEGGAKVSLGKRKAAPGVKKGLTLRLDKSGKERKDGSLASTVTPVLEAEDIDPNEERYCICGDVSYGTMIACENDACEKEWFHLPCVGLTEIPKRRQKWYCPECRINLRIDETGNPTATTKARKK